MHCRTGLWLACTQISPCGHARQPLTRPACVQTGVRIYGFAPPQGMGDADIAIVVTTQPDQPAAVAYCNPAYGQYLLNDPQTPSNYPQEGFAVWQTSAPPARAKRPRAAGRWRVRSHAPRPGSCSVERSLLPVGAGQPATRSLGPAV